MNSPLALTTSGLTKSYGGHLAIDKVTLNVPVGSIYAFVGPNGAGKTTTIYCLLGLIRPDAGETRILGGALREQRAALMRRVGVFIDPPSLYPHLTASENLHVTALMYGVDSTRTKAVLEIVELKPDDSKLVKKYSQGMRQRLGIAMALLPDPELLILDEPTNGLDPIGLRDFRELLIRIAKQGRTVFMSSHQLGELDRIATHVGLIRSGEIVFEGPMEEIAQRYGGLEAAFLDLATLQGKTS